MDGWQLALMAAVCWAAEALLIRKAGDGIDPLVGTALSCIAAGAVFAVYLLGIGKLNVDALNSSAVYYVLAGIVSFAVGHYFYYAAITKTGVSFSVSIAASYPLLAIILSWVLFKEPLTMRSGLGMLLIVAGGMILAI
ncbi:MAG: DMT family transporter [Candidatus Bathyarchaeota archaeon]|nr:DMT family transporter [Candidatus Bathyarchaeota archaeon]